MTNSESKPLFRFKIRATGYDPTGYYYVNWSKAQSLTVEAHTKAEATEKALALLGTHPRFGSFRRPGSGWTFAWDGTEEVPQQELPRTDLILAVLEACGVPKSRQVDALAAVQKLLGKEEAK